MEINIIWHNKRDYFFSYVLSRYFAFSRIPVSRFAFGDSRHTVNKDRFQFQFDFSQLKTLKIQKKIEKIIAKKSVFAIKKVLLHKNLKIATLRPITT